MEKIRRGLVFMKIAMQKKGQAGLEYMTLYGWVLLFAMIAISIVIFVSTTINPAGLQQKCSMLSLLECTNSYVMLTSTSPTRQVTLSIDLKNTGPDTFKITRIEASENGVDWSSFSLPGGVLELPPGNSSKITITGIKVSQQTEKGNMVRIFVKGKYMLCKYGKCSNDLDLTGEVIERVN